jgi:hypothetical protein
MRELLAAFLGDYLKLVEPDVVAHLDLENLVVLDIAGLPPGDGGEVVVAEARPAKGEKLTILVVVEPEPLGEPAIAHRLSQVFAALEIRLGQPLLVSMLFLRGGQAGVNLTVAPVTRVAGLDTVRLVFSTFGLEGSLAEYYLARPEPLAWGLAVLMSSRRFNRAQLKGACRERIRESRLDDRRLLLLRWLRGVGGNLQGLVS